MNGSRLGLWLGIMGWMIDVVGMTHGMIIVSVYAPAGELCEDFKTGCKRHATSKRCYYNKWYEPKYIPGSANISHNLIMTAIQVDIVKIQGQNDNQKITTTYHMGLAR